MTMAIKAAGSLPVSELVEERARQAVFALGVDGLVCSPEERPGRSLAPG
jgi:hypothetical protein